MNGSLVAKKNLHWSYPLKLEMDLRWNLLVGEKEDLVIIVDKYFNQLIDLKNHIDVIKSNILQVSIIITRKFMQLSGQENLFLVDYLALADALDNVNNIQDLKSFFSQYILSIWVYHKHLLEKKKAIITAKNYIKSNYHREIFLPDIARVVQMSPTYFSRLFSKKVNFSFQNYLTNVRIDIAKKILSNTNLAVENVGVLVGYVDVNYFIRVFKKSTGVTPGNFINGPDDKDFLLKDTNQKFKEPYSPETESMFLWSLFCRDQSAAEKIGKDLIVNIYRQGIDIYNLKSIILHLTIVLLRKCMQAGFFVENMLFQSINFYREIKNKNSYFEMNSFLSHVISEILKSSSGDSSNKEQVILKIKSYVKENYSNSIALNDISALVHLSPNYISRIFSQNTGMTLRQYLMNVRLQAAKNLLTNTALPVEEISCLVGYLDVSYFRKIFKQKVGRTPGSLRGCPTEINFR